MVILVDHHAKSVVIMNKTEGEFYTPEIFANFAHKILEKYFGKNWYDEYYVWDPAWGIGNLTRTKKFTHLYASTLHQSDIDNSDANPEAYKFKFDFLNDQIKSLFGIHVPESLYRALKSDKPIIFLMNPPYAAINDMVDGSKDVALSTLVQGYMGEIRHAKQNLFSQFLYRVMMIKEQFNLTNCNICVFSSSVFMSGSGYEKFRDVFLDNFHYVDGYLFNASYFDKCSKRWGISMSIWKSGSSFNRNDFPHHLIDVKNRSVKITGEKNIYNIDGNVTFRNFCKETLRGKKTYPTITLKNPITVGEREGMMMTTDAIGFYVNSSNNVYKSLQQCYLLSSAPDNILSGFSVTKDNFLPVCANFTSRKVISNNWINNKDEFLAPDVNDSNCETWQEFIADSVIYSMFNSSSMQSAMRSVQWKGYDYDIKNEFFFIGRKEMMQYGNEHDLYDLVRSTFDDNERYAYDLIENEIGKKLSREARDVLIYARKMVIQSMKYRSDFNEKHPEYKIMTWDAGYYQLKFMWKEYCPDMMKEFRKLYKKLSSKLKSQVYELNILK